MGNETHSSRACRGLAAKGVELVTKHNRTIDWVLTNRAHWFDAPETRNLLYGTIRHYKALAELIDPLLQKPLREKDSVVYSLMLVGAYQLKITHKPAHAVINETVNATRSISRPWARGLVNAVLRKVTSLDIKLDQTFGYDAWLCKAIYAAWPNSAADILAASNERAPMILRVNRRRLTREQYLERLFGEGIDAARGHGEQSIILSVAQPSATLPGWQDGDIAVQDMGAQFAAPLALAHFNQMTTNTPAQPRRILDACAAPGGKLAHLIELSAASESSDTQPAEIVGIDISPARVAQTEAVLSRLRHACSLTTGDASTLDWWDRQYFDHILLDAPCSGTGTIRRHPDIKLLLRESSIAEHAAVQLQILNNLWQSLRPGGTLLYCTCSILPRENDGVISQFLQRPDNDANVCSIELPTGQATRYGWQLLPTDPNTDGFYYAQLQKGCRVT
ncbi:MAG: 16S rRNA (cytosine(967)-C(5))-methyltransferase RsmB [bacterium]